MQQMNNLKPLGQYTWQVQATAKIQKKWLAPALHAEMVSSIISALANHLCFALFCSHLSSLH
jgi:hypothetical protein